MLKQTQIVDGSKPIQTQNYLTEFESDGPLWQTGDKPSRELHNISHLRRVGKSTRYKVGDRSSYTWSWFSPCKWPNK